jgi:general bacterial porin, GBP family
MKKLLIASAALAMVAGTAQAQSSVTVYGVLDVNYSSQNVNKAGAQTIQNDNALNTGRLGFKGTEDLGSGLKAEFQLEAKLSASTGALGAASTSNEVFNREAWVGLSDAKLGSVRLGTTDVTSAQSIDSTVGQAGNLSDATSNIGTDKNKSIRYTTPTWNGLTAQVGHSNEAAVASSTTGVQTEATTAKSITSAFVGYEAGNFGVYVGQSEQKQTATYNQKETAYGVKYNFGFATVGAYQSKQDATENTGRELTQTRVSVAAPVKALGGGVTAHAVYFKDSTANNSSIIVATDAVQAVDGYKLALTKAFSKRTTGYVAYIDQKDASSATTNDTKTYVVGVAHTF